MSQAIIQTVNSSNQSLVADNNISFGTTIHRYGCGLQQNGNGIEISGSGYYEIKSNVVVAPTEAGEVTVTIQRNGVNIPGATATATVAAAGDIVTLPIDFIIRRPCACCNSADIITMVIDSVATVTNIVTQIIKL